MGLDIDKIADAIHYPDCWDTAAYPTLESALSEVFASFRCTSEDTHPATPSADQSRADAERKCFEELCAAINHPEVSFKRNGKSIKREFLDGLRDVLAIDDAARTTQKESEKEKQNG